MSEENLHQNIEASKANLNNVSETLEHFDIDEHLEKQLRYLDDALRIIDIEFQALLKARGY